MADLRDVEMTFRELTGTAGVLSQDDDGRVRQWLDRPGMPRDAAAQGPHTFQDPRIGTVERNIYAPGTHTGHPEVWRIEWVWESPSHAIHFALASAAASGR